MPNPPVVAVFNASDDVVEMLRIAIENAGFVVVSAHIDDLRRGGTSFVDFIEEHDPQVIVYDIIPPYDRSWRFLEHLRVGPQMKGRQFVLTSTNAARAKELSGASGEIHEILGKPYDLDDIVRAVERAAGMHDRSKDLRKV